MTTTTTMTIHPSSRSSFLALLLGALAITGGVQAQSGDDSLAKLRSALTFHASFDHGIDADFALGDRKLYWAPSMKLPRVGKLGFPENGAVSHINEGGRFGGALRFHKKVPEIVFFQGEENFAYRTGDWSGTVSLWLKVDPSRELAPGFCDPIQITPRAWNDAAFFVEFEKRTNSIPFRLGAYADYNIWNPENREWGKIPFEEKPLVHVEKPPFSGDRWTHVVFTFENFNTGRKDGVAKLFLDAQLQGALSVRPQTFSWEPPKTLVLLGLSYVGLYDEVALFNRALSEPEIQTLHRLKDGVRSLGRLP